MNIDTQQSSIYSQPTDGEGNVCQKLFRYSISNRIKNNEKYLSRWPIE
jgi:hypothetical protein